MDCIKKDLIRKDWIGLEKRLERIGLERIVLERHSLKIMGLKRILLERIRLHWNDKDLNGVDELYLKGVECIGGDWIERGFEGIK